MTLLNLLLNMAICLTLTIIIEYPVVCSFYKDETSILRMVVLVNILTNPFVVFIYNVYSFYIGSHMLEFVLVIELLAFLVEGNIYSKYFDTSAKKAYFVSLVANSIAYLSGIIISNLIY